MGWEAFSKNIQFKVRVGNRVKFWTDRWCGDCPLHLAFLVLYNIATNKAASTDFSLLWNGMGDRKSWDVRFIRSPNDWEVDDFFQFLASKLPLADDGNRMSWQLTKNGDFNIRSFYHKLRGSSFIVFPRKVFGRLRHPVISLSLFGQLLGIGISQVIIYGVGVLILLTSVLSVDVVGK